jgi:8-amino-7-oxononanoate synthase
VRIAVTDASLRTRLRHNALTLRGVLDERGFALSGRADSHIVPIVIGDSRATVAAGAALRGRGLLVGAVRPPTVPEGTARLRISVSAAHTREHIDRLTAALDDLGTRSGLDHLVRSPASEVRPPRSTRRPDASVGGEATAVAG